MADIDDEVIARAIRWCAEAGRHASAEQVRTALTPLSWDEQLAMRALLADAPPARPLGPFALADVARGALPDVAAERERAGQYLADSPAKSAAPAPAPVDAAPARTKRRGATSRRHRVAAAPVIHRARDRVGPTTVPARPIPTLDALFESEGRAVLERLIRTHGARRGPLVEALAASWRRPDGSVPGGDDLARLLDAHGLARAFERRERDEILHALRAAGGVRFAAAARLGTTADELSAAVARLNATAEAEEVRASHRAEIRRRATLSERVRLLLGDAERLRDLGVLEEIEEDLRRRLPEHVRALRNSGTTPLSAALARTLAIAPRDLTRLSPLLGDALPGPDPTHRGPRPAGERPRTRATAARTGRRDPAAQRTPRRPGSPPRRVPGRAGPPRRPRSR